MLYVSCRNDIKLCYVKCILQIILMMNIIYYERLLSFFIYLYIKYIYLNCRQQTTLTYLVVQQFYTIFFCLSTIKSQIFFYSGYYVCVWELILQYIQAGINVLRKLKCIAEETIYELNSNMFSRKYHRKSHMMILFFFCMKSLCRNQNLREGERGIFTMGPRILGVIYHVIQNK